MKTYLGSIATVVAVLTLAAVLPTNTKGDDGSGGFGTGSQGSGLSRGDGGIGGERSVTAREYCAQDHYYGHGCYGFWPGGGPYGWPPYYYEDYYGNAGHPSPYYYDDNMPTYYSGDGSLDYPPYDGVDYLLLGYDSGKALRLKIVSQDWLVEYLRAYFINVLLSRRDDFRRGFVLGYGDGAASVLREAIQEARHPKPQPDTMPAPKSDEPAK
ncbi:MAG: hypothetical protein ABSD58_16230 [Verrucomicrobiia bacterium]|jgi:hypothetical protein